MIQRRQQPRLALESGEPIRIDGKCHHFSSERRTRLDDPNDAREPSGIAHYSQISSSTIPGKRTIADIRRLSTSNATGSPSGLTNLTRVTARMPGPAA